ncbi:energy-coupling factor transporter transmembrane component T family protein [Methanofollis ethanolicus]|uniref:energy-coupling factor transporter transmembrane component T family protein n=1 Tax=Methanofollis ethanolicus TaxID=488124 RepID=UPI000832A82F|nr:energy-coupling factor transporter transmembrane component T [Methanofollis ethanolicus]
MTKKGVYFVPGNTWLHRLDPATKTAALVIVSATALLTEEPLPVFALCAGVALIATLSHLFRPFVRSLRFLTPLFLFVLIIDAFFPRAVSGAVYVTTGIGPLQLILSEGGILFALAMGLRLLAIGGYSFLFIMTTPFSEFVGSMRSLGLPNTLAFSLGYALRSISALTADVAGIMDAQRSRGLEFDRGNLLENRHKILALFVPATVLVLSRARQVSEAMECRGFGCTDHPTRYGKRSVTPEDAYLILLVLACAALAAALS